MMLRRIASLLFPSLREPMPCESCGNDFVCGAGITGCWCLKVKLDADARAELRRQFSNCLCVDCLNNASAGKPDLPA